MSQFNVGRYVSSSQQSVGNEQMELVFLPSWFKDDKQMREDGRRAAEPEIKLLHRDIKHHSSTMKPNITPTADV